MFRHAYAIFSLILGFHSRDTSHDNGCYPPSLCRSRVNKSNKSKKRRDVNAIYRDGPLHCSWLWEQQRQTQDKF